MNTRIDMRFNAGPTLAILIGASIWGVVWYPLRMLAALGVSGTATIFGGAALVSAGAALFEAMPAPPAGAHLATAAWLVVVLGSVLGTNNMLVQYGLARVPANRASIIMLFEIVVTALSAWLLAGETPGPREWAGGACIVLASALSSRVHRGKPASQPGDDSDPERRKRSRAMV